MMISSNSETLSFLIDGDVLLSFVLIKNPSDSLASEHQIINILMSYSENAFLDLLQEPLKELRSTGNDKIVHMQTQHSN